MKIISKLQYITQDLLGFSHADLALHACENGLDWVQFRMKENVSVDEKVEEALKVQVVCEKYNAVFIINDDVDIAKQIDADGVHLGKNDMSPNRARDILGEDKIIGGTANTYDDLIHLIEAGVDYIGLGPFKYTATKNKLSPILGLKGYQNIMDQYYASKLKIPIIAVGGIGVEDISEILSIRIHGVAVASLISRAQNKTDMINKILSKIN